MIKSLTSLRGIFILFIFFHHCMRLYPGGGTMAVAFFFVLGGFSMTLGYKDKIDSQDFSYREYLTRRCIKFYPLHWLCLLAAVPYATLSFNWKHIPIFTINAALLQTWVPIRDVYSSFNAVSWYLADTMFFALIFPFILKTITRTTTKGKIFITLVMITAYLIISMSIPAEKYHAIMYIAPYIRLMDFVYGLFLAMCYLKIKKRLVTKWNNTVCQMVIVSLIVLLVVESCLLPESISLFAPVYWIPVALLIVITSLSEQLFWGGQHWLKNRWLRHLGELSFVIFMTHWIILKYARVIYFKTLHFENSVIYVLLTLAMTVVVSKVMDRYILKPIIQWLTERNQRSMTARS